MTSLPISAAELGYLVFYTAVALFLLTWVGNTLCKYLLDRTGLSDARDDLARAAEAKAAAEAKKVGEVPAPSVELPSVGRWVGTFERFLVVVGLLAGSWEIVGAVIALKTVARFKELDEKLLAEYFLVGSLFSLAWALLITGLWWGYDHILGVDLVTKLSAALSG